MFFRKRKTFHLIFFIFFLSYTYNLSKGLKKRKKLILYYIELVLSNIFSNFAARKKVGRDNKK